MKKRERVLSYIVIFALVFGLGWWANGFYYQNIYLQSKPYQATGQATTPDGGLTSIFGSQKKHDDIKLDTFWEVWDRLHEKYVNVDALKKEQLVYGAIKGMTQALDDPYTEFMTPDETQEFDHSLNGELEGIGAELSIKDQALVVVSPLKNSPAQKAGLLPGDIIYKIDGGLTSELSLFDAIYKIRGKKGTEVTLTILRKNQTKPLEIKIIRDTVNIESVTLEEKSDGIYYIAINQFSDNTKQEFDEAIGEIMLKQPKGLIIDLRYNGGGYLITAVDLLSIFIKGQPTVVDVKARDASESESLKVTGNPKMPDVPLVVLINKGSASASEIFAGAIQDLKRGIIIGEQSFGKGSVQAVEKLSDDSSIRYTLAKWYTPLGRSINEVGIEPDIKVELTEKDAEEEKDPQLDAAIDYLKKL
jgi:carboxyl-terminal processing protease